MVESAKRNFNLDDILPKTDDSDAEMNEGRGIMVDDDDETAKTPGMEGDPPDPAVEQNKKEECERRAEDIRSLGMSALCKRVLGLPLDKTEQCSVWDRRPLRYLQIRYAALDAYCVLMLYDKCVKWAEKLEVDIGEILAQQDQIRVSLPLFFTWPEADE